MNWMIQEQKKVKGEDVWQSILFYGSLDAAAKGVLDLQIRSSGAQSIEALRVAMDETVLELIKALTPEYTIDVREKVLG